MRFRISPNLTNLGDASRDEILGISSNLTNLGDLLGLPKFEDFSDFQLQNFTSYNSSKALGSVKNVKTINRNFALFPNGKSKIILTLNPNLHQNFEAKPNTENSQQLKHPRFQEANPHRKLLISVLKAVANRGKENRSCRV